MNKDDRKWVELPLDDKWRVCPPEEQYQDRTGKFVAFKSCYVAILECHVEFYGYWNTLEEVEEFCRIWWAAAKWTVRRVEPYWYCPERGRVGTVEAEAEAPANTRDEGLEMAAKLLESTMAKPNPCRHGAYSYGAYSYCSCSDIEQTLEQAVEDIRALKGKQ